MSGMAEVLAAHQDAEAPNGGRFCICGEWEGSWTGTSFAAHQAAMLTAAGFGPVKEAAAKALEEAAQDFEDNIGVGEFDELACRDGARWAHIADAWEYQGPYMDWLRARADAVRGEG